MGAGEQPPRARILLSNLSGHIAARERAVIQARLRHLDPDIAIEQVASPGPGNAVTVTLPAAHASEVVTAFGERQVPAEKVAELAANDVLKFLDKDVPVGRHLADQLLVPMALCGGGVFRTVRPSLHATTNVQVIERFVPMRFTVEEDHERPGTCTVHLSIDELSS